MPEILINFLKTLPNHWTLASSNPFFSIMIAMYAKHIDLGKFTQDELDQIIRNASQMADLPSSIDSLSKQFLGIGYSEQTLIGDKDTQEVFVINLRELDCFTFIEYVEAMRLSVSFQDFGMHLRKVRYKSGAVDFTSRNHFFTDWREDNTEFVNDITEEIGGMHTAMTHKILNEKEDGTPFVPGLAPVEREVSYIPSGAVDAISEKLRTGDYLGIYSKVKGLDVSHVGIIIREDNTIFLRHGSSQKKYRKVIDQDFHRYIAGKPGIIVLRPIDSKY